MIKLEGQKCVFLVFGCAQCDMIIMIIGDILVDRAGGGCRFCNAYVFAVRVIRFINSILAL